MQGTGNLVGYSLDHIVHGFDWAGLSYGAKVGDVHPLRISLAVLQQLSLQKKKPSGFLSIAIANNFPNLSFTVQDQQVVVDMGRELLPESLKHRIDFQVHDFFTLQPVVADIFLLRHVCHDWPTGLLPRQHESSRTSYQA